MFIYSVVFEQMFKKFVWLKFFGNKLKSSK